MYTRKTILAFAIFATLVTVALAPTSASAWGHGGRGGGHFGGGGHHLGGRGWGHHHWGGWGWGHRFGWNGVLRPQPCWRGLPCSPVPRPVVPIVASGPPAGPAPNPPPSGRECLAKGYLPDGSVVFADRCTHEGAVAQRGEGPPAEAQREGPGS
jgi:hypothetical protein